MIYRYLATAAAVLAILGGAYGKGWSDRGEREAARVAELVAERRVQAARIKGQAEQLAQLQAERDRLAEELEDAALADDDAGRPAFGPGSVQRLNRR